MYIEPWAFLAVTKNEAFFNESIPFGWKLHDEMYRNVKKLCPPDKSYGVFSGHNIVRLASPFIGISEGFLVILLRIEVAARTIVYGLQNIVYARSDSDECYVTVGVVCLVHVLPRRFVEVLYSPFEALTLAVVTTAGILYSPKDWVELNEITKK